MVAWQLAAFSLKEKFADLIDSDKGLTLETSVFTVANYLIDFVVDNFL